MATHRPVVATHRRLVALEKAEACARSFASGSVTRMQRGRGRVRLVDVWTGLMALPEFYCVAHLPRQLCCACELCVNDHGRAKTDQSPSYSVCTIIGRRDGIHSFACCKEFIKGETSLTTLIQLQRMRRQHERFNGYFSVTTSQARVQPPGFVHVGSAHVLCRLAPCRESTGKPRGRSMRPPIRPN